MEHLGAAAGDRTTAAARAATGGAAAGVMVAVSFLLASAAGAVTTSVGLASGAFSIAFASIAFAASSLVASVFIASIFAASVFTASFFAASGTEAVVSSLKSLMVVSGTNIEVSQAEIRKWGRSRWAVGIWPSSGIQKPLDHPDLESIWAACADEGLCVTHHSFTWTPPYFPGYRDMWDNLFLSRSAAHPWGGMRAMGSFIGSGIMDRYPSIRFGILECGCGWLPFWTRRGNHGSSSMITS